MTGTRADASPGRLDAELGALARHLPVLDYRDVAAVRLEVKALLASLPVPDPGGIAVREVDVAAPHGRVPVRAYDPGGAGDRPALLLLHGGGFVAGDLDAVHADALALAAGCAAVVVSIDYRLAPEHPFPAALDDAWTVLGWVHAGASELGVDAERVGVLGVSAGGCIAAGLALRARDHGVGLRVQVLDVPVLDDRLRTRSMQTLAEATMWRRSDAELTWSHYLADSVADPPGEAAPARAADLTGVAPAVVLVCDQDPLRDEGLEHARRLLDAGVPVDLRLTSGTFHGSALIPSAVSAQMAAERLWLVRRALGPPAGVPSPHE